MIGTEFPIDIDLIRRIETVRGPVSSLYGSNALFAVINIITKRAEEVNGIELSAEAGSFNTYKGRISYGRKFPQLQTAESKLPRQKQRRCPASLSGQCRLGSNVSGYLSLFSKAEAILDEWFPGVNN